MAEQSFQSHAHRPTHTGIVGLFALIALILLVMQWLGWQTRDLALLAVVLAVFELAWISRVYTVRLQDRIILLEMKVRAAEVLAPEQEALLAKLDKKQIVALRFASDAELGTLIERAAHEQLPPREIKAAIKTWRPDLLRT